MEKASRKDGWVDHLERRSNRRAKRTVLAKRLYCVFLYGWHVTSWTWGETGNGNQVILQSTAYIMPGRRAARTHLSLPTAQPSQKSHCPSSAGPDLSGARGTRLGTSSRRCFLLSRDLFSRMGISRQSPKDIHDLMFAFSVDSRGIRKWRKGCDLVSFSPKGNGH